MEEDFNNMLGDLSSVIKDLEFFSVVRFMISNLGVYCLKCTGLELLGWEHTWNPYWNLVLSAQLDFALFGTVVTIQRCNDSL